MNTKKIIRTPEESFKDIQDFKYSPKFLEDKISFKEEIGPVRIAYIDEGKKNKPKATILFLHGHPTWSYLWRHLIPIALRNNYRVIAPDLLGFGRSDKLLEEKDYSFIKLRNNLLYMIDKLELNNIILVLHEWGGTLGLTLPMEMPEKFFKIVCFNSYLATGNVRISDSYKKWLNHNKDNQDLNIRALMARTNRILSLSECNAYGAPFPDKNYKSAIRALPSIFPLNSKDPGAKISQDSELWWRDNQLNQIILVNGVRDPLIPIENMKILSSLISKNGVINTIGNAGHFVPEWGMEFGNKLFSELNETNAE